MLRLGVRVLLLVVSPFFVLSCVPLCTLFPALAYDDDDDDDDDVNSCV
jgi:hypothetical protein